MPETAEPAEARLAYATRQWAAAASGFERSREDGALSPDDLALWSRSAWWLGRPSRCLALAEAAFAAYRDADRVDDAAATALRISLLRLTGGDVTVGTAWLRRAEGLLRDRPDGVLHAYLTYLEASLGLADGGAVWQTASVERLRDLAQRLPDPAVNALSLVVSGLADLRGGSVARGFAHLDQAMLEVLAGEVEPEWAGDVFCTTIRACYELADHRRMRDWTRATEEWCRPFGSDAIYTGVCRVHRLELRSEAGDWDSVEDALTEVCGALAPANPWVAGEGWYQLGELRRLRGDAAGARQAYAIAREAGIDPVPGEALLEFEHGAPQRAWNLITTALAGRDRLARARLLRAGVEIALATGRGEAARALGEELRAIADDYDSPGFHAWADQADGMVALARGEAAVSIVALRSALEYFRRHGLRCEQARALAWLAAALDRAGEHSQAEHLRAEASALFARIGARVQLGVVGSRADVPAGPLTPREQEILEHVAGGASNRDIADRLFISEKTVGRHLANIYLKLGVGSRTAAAAWWRDERA